MDRVIKYPGSKQRIAPWIIEKMPTHHSYLEPYFGSGAILFSKPQSKIETVNDIDSNICNLFKVIRNHPEELYKVIYYTPYSRQEYNESFEINNSEDSIEKARKFLIRCWQGHGFRTNKYKVGWKNDVQGREASYSVRDWNKLPQSILQIVERLKQIQIENVDAVKLIKRFNYNNVLIYADPPYLLTTRSGESYEYEMTEEDHIKMLEVLLQHKGPVMISGYESELYKSYLSEWIEFKKSTTAEYGGKRTETLWMNTEPPCMQIKIEC